MQNTNISYRAEEAREYGINVAILLNNIRVFSEYHEQKQTEYWHSMKDIAEAVGLSPRQIADASKRAKEAGLIDYRQGYRPNSQIRTTYWYLKEGVSESTKTVLSVDTKTDTSIYKSKRNKSNKGDEMNRNVQGIIKKRRELKWSTPYGGSKKEPQVAKHLLDLDTYPNVIGVMEYAETHRSDQFMPKVSSLDDLYHKYRNIKDKIEDNYERQPL